MRSRRLGSAPAFSNATTSGSAPVAQAMCKAVWPVQKCRRNSHKICQVSQHHVHRGQTFRIAHCHSMHLHGLALQTSDFIFSYISKRKPNVSHGCHFMCTTNSGCHMVPRGVPWDLLTSLQLHDAPRDVRGSSTSSLPRVPSTAVTSPS